MHDDDFFARFVSMFEAIATTPLDHVDQLEHVFDLTVAPPVMVRARGRAHRTTTCGWADRNRHSGASGITFRPGPYRCPVRRS